MDLAATQAKLEDWLRGRLPDARDVALSPLKRPAAGFSNETYMCDLSYRDASGERSEQVVIRLEPRYRVFPEYDLEKQFRIMAALAGTDVPVPRVRWYEGDRSILGSSFYIMDRVEGEIPPEVPPYHAFGMMFDSTPERRERIWWNGLDALVRVHALDWRKLGLSFLGEPAGGTGPIDRQLDYYAAYLEWVKEKEAQPTLDASLKWLRDNRYEPKRVTLCWGDSRLPNQVFRDDRVAAVLDWEMAWLGDPEADLAWWIFLDWQGCVGYGIPRLEGFPSAEETVRRYEELSGAKVEHAFYNEVFAAFRFGVILARVAHVMAEAGMRVSTPDFSTNNVCTQRLADLLHLPPPGEQRREMTDIKKVTVRVQFHLTGPGGSDWYLVSEGGEGTRHAGVADRPDVVLTATAADWTAIRAGEIDRTQAFLGGKLKIEGDLTLLMQLEDVITRLGDA
jgi:aminoglycoside phosphotransferase (APT) family kinase protein/putative sterol carrier protein